MPKKAFLRRTWSRYSKLGRKRKKIQKWRKPKGRDNKMREKRKGYPAVVGIGNRTPVKMRYEVSGARPAKIMNPNDVKNLKEGQTVIMGNIGDKKKIEIIKAGKEKKIKFANLNVKKFLKESKRKMEKKTVKIETKAEKKNRTKKEDKKPESEPVKEDKKPEVKDESK
jgi:large subunit ribosomal protein L32e